MDCMCPIVKGVELESDGVMEVFYDRYWRILNDSCPLHGRAKGLPQAVTEVRHITQNGKYEVVFEKAASANKIDGFKIRVNSDDIEAAKTEAQSLYQWALQEVESMKPIVPAKPEGGK